MFLGLDCSTQSFSALIIDAREGTIVYEASVNFEQDLPHYQTTSGFVNGDGPGEVFSNPLMWLEALDLLMGRLVDAGVDLSAVEAVSGSGQQHATVYLNEHFHSTLASLDSNQTLKEQLKPCFSRELSPIWMDSSTSEECREISEALGGDHVVCQKTGSIAIERFSGPQIRRFSKRNPDGWQNTSLIHLNSSFLASVLAGKSVSIDHGDGAGMNLMNLSSGDWDSDAVEATAPQLSDKLPALAPSATIAGKISSYFSEKYGLNPEADAVLWSGDNPCSLVGMGAASPGKMVISLGTSYTLFAAMDQPLTDPNGFGHVFGNPCGNFMSLICFSQGALALEKLRSQLDITWEQFSDAALSQKPSPIRTLLDEQFHNMKSRSDWMGETPDTIYVTGGASQNQGICQTIANTFKAKVQRMGTSASAALGAAMRAAHATGEFSLDQLEKKFTQPAPDSLISPAS
ncbi:MAG: carbohydrate kinase [Verrucomicrobiae bacterium]|nr:carbohydrate kinase [Verrucomicrobiae bacterium]NNJ86523.1 carbohydrate kinase [Akkermansiaceae bacterium]